MTTSTTTVVTVTPTAAARISERGLQSHVDRMVDYALQTLSELDRIEVKLHDRYEMGQEPAVAIEVWSRNGSDTSDTTFWELAQWMTSEFSAAVLENLHMSIYPGIENAR